MSPLASQRLWQHWRRERASKVQVKVSHLVRNETVRQQHKMHMMIKPEVICLCHFMEIPKLISCVLSALVCVNLRRLCTERLQRRTRVYVCWHTYVAYVLSDAWVRAEHKQVVAVLTASHHLNSHLIQFWSCTRYIRPYRCHMISISACPLAAMRCLKLRIQIHHRENNSQDVPETETDLIYWYI